MRDVGWGKWGRERGDIFNKVTNECGYFIGRVEVRVRWCYEGYNILLYYTDVYNIYNTTML